MTSAAPDSSLRLLGCDITVARSGNYEIRLEARGGDGQRLIAVAGVGAKESPADVVFTFVADDGRTVATRTLSATELLALLGHGYDFGEQSRTFHPDLTPETAPRVAFTLIDPVAPGGGPAVVFRYANWLADLGVGVTIYSDHEAPSWTTVNVAVREIRDSAQRYAAIDEPVVVVYSILELPVLLRHMDLAGKRVLHLCQGLESFHYGADFAGLLAPKPLFDLLHSLPVGRIVISPHLASEFSREQGRECHLIPNGIDERMFVARRDRALRLDDLRILCVGTPGQLLKGVSTLLAALGQCAERHPDWRIRLVLVSGAAVAREEIERHARGFALSLHCGQTPTQMRHLYHGADMLVGASWYEGFGLPALEAMACGVPVVQAENRGLEGIARQGENCLVVPPNNPAMLAEGIEAIVASSELRTRLTSGGLDTARAWTMRRQFAKFAEAFGEILGHRFDAGRVASIDRLLASPGADVLREEATARSNPLFSVLVPSYNQANFLTEALDTLLAQTYPHWEALVVNDGSTDDTAQVAAAYAARDARVRVFNKPNGGVGSALNEGLRQAQGDWICWLSSDDKFLPDKLQLHADACRENPAAVFFHTDYLVLLEEQKRTVGSGRNPGSVPPRPLQLLNLFQCNYFNGISVAVRRTLFEQFGEFSERLRYGQDFAMWLRIVSRYPAHYIDRPTCVTRVHPGQDTQQFMEAGFIDSGVACLEFLNGHPFAEIFPWSDLADPEQAEMAVRYVFGVVLDLNSYVSYCGFSLALLERMREWLCGTPPTLRSTLQPFLARFADQAAGGDLPPDLGSAILSLPRQLDRPFAYRAKDALTELRRHLAWLKKKADQPRIAAFEKYFAHRQRIDAQSRTPVVAAQPAPLDGLRILMVLHNFVPHHYGGVEVYSFNLAKQLRNLGHAVEVFYPLPEFGTDAVSVSSEEIDGLHVWKLRTPLENSVQAQIHGAAIEHTFRKLLDAGHYDVVHFQHTLNLPFGLVELASRSGAAVTYSFHDFWAICPRVTLYRAENRQLCAGPESAQGCAQCLAGMLGRTGDAAFVRGLRTALAARSDYLRTLWRSVDVMTAPSGYVADKLHRHGVEGEIRVLPLGIVPVSPPPRQPASTKLTFGFIGNIHPLKNADVLVGAFLRVQGDARLLLFGGGLRQDVDRIEEMARADRRIEYRGRFLPTQLPDILAQLDLLVVPSASESFGLVAREALSAGVPVATANVGGVAEAIREGENGCLFDPGDEEGLAALLQRFVDHPASVRSLTVDRGGIWTIEADAGEWSTRYAHMVAAKRQGAVSEAPSTADADEPAASSVAGGYEYLVWCNARRLSVAEARLFERRVESWGALRPRFHLAVLLSVGQEDLLIQTIRSLTQQYYYDVVLTVVANAPAPAGFTGERLRWRQDGGAPLAAASAALVEAEADWIGLLRPGDQVAAHAFLFLAEAASAHPAWLAIYTDHDYVDGDGMRGGACFKPDFNYDLLCSQSYVGGLLTVRRDLLARVGGLDVRTGTSAEFDLLLKAYEAAGSAGIGHVPDVLVSRPAGMAEDMPSAQTRARCVADHLMRLDRRATVFPGLAADSLHVVHEFPDRPRVSVLIVPESGIVSLQQCVESVIGNTDYPGYEILLACPADAEDDVLAYLDGIRGLGEARLRVIATASAGRSAAVDILARQATGDYLLLLSDRVRAVQDSWLAEMVNHGQRPEVGVVGARLLAADGSVRHAGLLLGVAGIVRSAFSGLAADQPGYLGRAQSEQDFSAVSGDCLLVGRALFEDLGGWIGRAEYMEAFADVDFCLRARAAGRLVAWTPFATLLQTALPVCEPESLARATDRMYRRWLPALAVDPAYNRNLTVSGPEFEINPDRLATWDPLSWRPLPRVLVQPADREGSGEYRILAPMRALFETGRAECRDSVASYSSVEMARVDPDTIVVQRQIRDELLDALERHQRYSRALRVYEIDDLITNIPRQSAHRDDFAADTYKRLRKAVGLCDRMVVSTDALADAYKDLSSDIRVVPNYLERSRWAGLAPGRRATGRPRVGWAGGSSHQGDLRVVADVVRELAREVDWVFFGSIPPELQKYAVEHHAPVAFEHYHKMLATLDLHLAIAPLEQNAFNEAKSNLRLLEFGVLGYPVVCTDIEPYRSGLPVTRVKNRYKDWVAAIRAHVRDPGAAAREGDVLREQVLRDWMLEDHLDAWMSAWLR